VRLADVIGRWIGKVEIVLAGADEDLREGEAALLRGDAMGARAAAHRVLARAPESPVGLALLADACEAAHLDAEFAMTLEELARRAPSRPEVWVRLGRARSTTGAAPDDVREAFVRGLAVADSGSESRRDALLGLADLDLAQGESARAELWLERLPNDHSLDVVVLRAEARLGRGDASAAVKLLDTARATPTDGRAAMVRGRALAELGDPAAFIPLVRAMVLDVPGASEALCSAVARVPSDAQTRARLHSVVDAKGEQNLARWRAAFARAEGAHKSARDALREAVQAGDSASLGPLLDTALEDRDPIALDVAIQASPAEPSDPRLPDARSIANALHLGGRDALDALGPIGRHVAHPHVSAWADAIASSVARNWIPASGAPASWSELLGRLDAHAHAIGALDIAAQVAELATERSRPVRLAVVGEFNAGKSTFINALVGAEVAPMGILPTTATLHHLRFSPDRFAKIVFDPGHDPPERIVALGDLRSTLGTLNADSIARVEIRMPLPSLVRVEVLDTPGFNAPEREHERIARSALAQADIALWLLDATQAIKQSERLLLEEAQAWGLPLQVLVNKADRLAPADLVRVLTSVQEALAAANIASWAEPLALSAKMALAGKLGDAKLLEESRWNAVERLLDQRIVARSDELKERTLRRRARNVVEGLVDVWTKRSLEEETETRKQSARTTRAGQAAARIDEDADALATQLAQSLAAHANAWVRDVDLVLVARDPDAAARDPAIARYRVDRALAGIAPALSRALASLAPETDLLPSDVMAGVRAVVRAATWGAPAGGETLLRAIVPAVARAGVATLLDQLFAMSMAPAPPARSAGVLRELRAFASALH
jgi:GTP-binding protein EngB required for normal cell division